MTLTKPASMLLWLAVMLLLCSASGVSDAEGARQDCLINFPHRIARQWLRHGHDHARPLKARQSLSHAMLAHHLHSCASLHAVVPERRTPLKLKIAGKHRRGRPGRRGNATCTISALSSPSSWWPFSRTRTAATASPNLVSWVPKTATSLTPLQRKNNLEHALTSWRASATSSCRCPSVHSLCCGSTSQM